jgi:chromosome segregation ATPase
MEIKKNNFEALYKKNDQLLRETETKLEKEINEKQRLEWTTKNLNMELNRIKQNLQSLEDEKDILNQRCVKLKEERDNYGKKICFYTFICLQIRVLNRDVLDRDQKKWSRTVLVM